MKSFKMKIGFFDVSSFNRNAVILLRTNKQLTELQFLSGILLIAVFS